MNLSRFNSCMTSTHTQRNPVFIWNENWTGSFVSWPATLHCFLLEGYSFYKQKEQQQQQQKKSRDTVEKGVGVDWCVPSVCLEGAEEKQYKRQTDETSEEI